MKSTLKYLMIALAGLIAFAPIAQAATYTGALATATSGYASKDRGLIYTIEADVDFSDQNVITNDVYQVIGVPADSTVLMVQAEVISASTTNVGANHTITVGDGSDADGWITSLDVRTEATDAASTPSFTGTMTFQTLSLTGSVQNVAVVTNGTVAVVSSPAYGIGKTYTAADTIDITSLGNQTNGVVRIRAHLLDNNKSP